MMTAPLFLIISVTLYPASSCSVHKLIDAAQISVLPLLFFLAVPSLLFVLKFVNQLSTGPSSSPCHFFSFWFLGWEDTSRPKFMLWERFQIL